MTSKPLFPGKQTLAGILRHILLFIFLLNSCSQAKYAPAKPDRNTFYNCSMHPQIHEEKPGGCPICGMKLIKVENIAISGTSRDSGALVLSPQQIKLGSIKTILVRVGNSERLTQLSGTVRTNESHTEQVSSRVAGRIEQLFVRSTGAKINMGSPLYSVYSEELGLTESEYLLAAGQLKGAGSNLIDYNALVSAAENKLLLWGLTKGQVSAIGKRGKASLKEVMISRVQGIVSEISVHEGDYITEGSPVLKTEQLSGLWVEAQAYASETAFQPGDQATILFPELQGMEITGRLSFIQPELAESSSIYLLRIPVENREGKIRPGMQVSVSIRIKNDKGLRVPTSALISDGKSTYVWLEIAAGKFIKREVETDKTSSDEISVTMGLMPGDRIVTEGVYLLNSEAILKNVDAPKGMDPNMKM